MPTDHERAVLRDLVATIQYTGWFPAHGVFMRRDNRDAIQALRLGGFIRKAEVRGDELIPLPAGLRLIRTKLPFARDELRRATDLLIWLQEQLESVAAIPKTATYAVDHLLREAFKGRGDEDMVRRALQLLWYYLNTAGLKLPGAHEGRRPESVTIDEHIWDAKPDVLLDGPKPGVLDAGGFREATAPLRARGRGKVPVPVLVPEEIAMNVKPATDRKKVFVIVGRNARANDAMFTFLRALGLSPLEFPVLVADAGEGSPYIGHAIQKGMQESGAVIALFTPDEECALRLGMGLESSDDSAHDRKRFQGRPNVIFEAGMAMGMAPQKTVLVTLGADVSLFSDTDGRHCVRMNNSPKARNALKLRLAKLCEVADGSDWLSTGDFESCLVPVVPKPPKPQAPARPTKAGRRAAVPEDRRK